jgi:hypothetical protein
MFKDTLGRIQAYITPPVSIVFWALFAFLSIFILWKKLKETQWARIEKGFLSKEFAEHFRQVNLFDILWISFLAAIVLSRLIYFAFSGIENACWFWIPYEKIGEQVYYFRCLPWSFLNIWDGGLSLSGFLLGFWIMIYISVYIYKIKWSSIFPAFKHFFLSLLLGFSLFGAVKGRSELYLGVFGITVIALILLRVFKFEFLKFKFKDVIVELLDFLLSAWAFVAYPILLMPPQVEIWDECGLTNMGIPAFVTTGTLILGVWMFLGGTVFKLLPSLSRRPKSGTDRPDESLSARNKRYKARRFGVNQSAGKTTLDKKREEQRLKEDEGIDEQSGRAGADKRGEALRKSPPASSVPKERSFAMSYKDFDKGWKKLLNNFLMLFKRRRPSDEDSQE